MTSAHAVDSSLAGRVVFITGSSSSMGATMVAAFAQQKSKVAFVDIDETGRLRPAVRAGLGDTLSYFERCDVRNVAALRRAIDSARRGWGPSPCS